MFENIKKPIWANAERTVVDCIVTHEKYGEIQFTASSMDSEDHGVNLFLEIASGKYGEIADYVPPPALQATARPINPPHLIQVTIPGEVL